MKPTTLPAWMILWCLAAMLMAFAVMMAVSEGHVMWLGMGTYIAFAVCQMVLLGAPVLVLAGAVWWTIGLLRQRGRH
ncbi:hypothetical protein [Asticcacaulis sp. AC402]|uniref:hypothetical protein n=1 Tax=Asticcacaulis sp. AC402 TaxID=1282361 RepID=UPI0012DE91C7|nr:hypothetical protein [Asticcacaulis sp. AC402]